MGEGVNDGLEAEDGRDVAQQQHDRRKLEAWQRGKRVRGFPLSYNCQP